MSVLLEAGCMARMPLPRLVRKSVHALPLYPAKSVEQDRGEDEQADQHAFKKAPDEVSDLAQIYGDDQRVTE